MKQLKKRILVLILALSMLGTVFIVGGCEGNRTFSNEEHIERISARVQERFMDNADYPYTDFTVTILYDIWGSPTRFMVEFMPDGFFYGTIYRNNYYMNMANFWRGSQMPCLHIQEAQTCGWYIWDGGDEPDIRVYRSHFYVFGKMNERKFLLFLGGTKDPTAYGFYFLSDLENGIISSLCGNATRKILTGQQSRSSEPRANRL